MARPTYGELIGAAVIASERGDLDHAQQLAQAAGDLRRGGERAIPKGTEALVKEAGLRWPWSTTSDISTFRGLAIRYLVSAQTAALALPGLSAKVDPMVDALRKRMDERSYGVRCSGTVGREGSLTTEALKKACAAWYTDTARELRALAVVLREGGAKGSGNVLADLADQLDTTKTAAKKPPARISAGAKAGIVAATIGLALVVGASSGGSK